MNEAKPSKKVSLLGGVRWENCVAGVSGGVISTLILHPLDLIKVRFQGKFATKGSLLKHEYIGVHFVIYK